MTATKQEAPTRGRIPQWTFADRARRVRRDLGLGQAEMAQALKVGLKAYSAWETGKNTPDDIAEIAVRFERVSGVPRTWFLGWADDNGPTSEEAGPYLAAVRPPGLEPGTHWIRDNVIPLHKPRGRRDRSTGPKGRAA